MQISATTSITPTLPLDRQTTNTPAPSKAQEDQAKALKASKAAEQDLAEPKVFTPAPPLRPNIQDYVDINRTLLALRKP